MIHDLVSELVARLRANEGASAEDLVQRLERGAKEFVCPMCGVGTDDPFVGLVEEPQAKVIFYCPACNDSESSDA
jgi:predicted RNA-binding Zn-ribbon protein involved in translation (DUF1610 family)